MTLIIGMKCSNGIVMGADGAATYVTSVTQQTIRQPVKKLSIIDNKVIIGISGPLGMSEQFKAVLEKLWIEKAFSNKQTHEVMRILKENFYKQLEPEIKSARDFKDLIGHPALQNVLTQTLIGICVSKSHRLFIFDHQCSPEEAAGGICFYSVGIGQAIADPFLAFLRKIFWPDNLPAISDGIFAVLWTLKHAIETIPGNVADPKQIVVLENPKDWKARELTNEELYEHYQAINDAENSLKDFKKEVGGKGQETDIEIPQLPKK